MLVMKWQNTLPVPMVTGGNTNTRNQLLISGYYWQVLANVDFEQKTDGNESHLLMATWHYRQFGRLETITEPII